MAIKALVSSIVVGLAVSSAVAPAQDPAPAQAPGYAWADSCKTCHSAIYEAWAKTKHASALDRLSGSQQEEACVGCHVTGPKTRVMEGGRKVLNKGVQCESCHGAAAAHAADPNVKTGLVKTPPSRVCEECHNDKSPKFKGFWYDAMKPLVHR